MNYRAFIVVCLILFAVVFAPVWAQGANKANKNVVVESVDEDVVEGDAPSAAVDEGAAKVPVVDKNTDVDKKSAVDTKNAAKKEIDLDALLLSDDDGDLLVEEKKAVVPAAADPALSDTSAKSGELAGEQKTHTADSVAQTPGGRRGGRGAVPKTAAAKVDAASLGPAVIEDGRSINFAHNLSEYRSPRIAMLLSLLVPGLGQAYARSYVKAGAFGAAELATIGVAIYFNVMGNNKYEEAKSFANDNYDVDRMKIYEGGLLAEFEKRIDDGRITDSMDRFPQDYGDTSFYEAARNGESYYYESIRGDYFTPGWKDSGPSLAEILTLSVGDTVRGADSSKYVLYYQNPAVENSATEAYFYLLTRIASSGAVTEGILGYSSNQAKYNSMMEKSGSYYDAVNYTFYVLLLNHIASAIDAGFTARAYNARLLGQESVWNRLSVEQMYVYTGSEVSPGIALRWRF